MRVWDATGKEHLDGVSGGVWTVNVGYGRESIANAVRDQLVKMNYFANSAGSIPGAMFAKKLIEKMPGMSRVYYSNSGSEANEKAFKMIRQISHRHHGGRKYKILYRDRDYHGTTLAALSAGGQPAAGGAIRPAGARLRDGAALPRISQPVPGRRELWPGRGQRHRGGDPARGSRIRWAACAWSPITAGGGVITPPAGYWERVQEICARVQYPVAYRRGRLRRGPHRGLVRLPALRGVKPDFVTMAKGVASGYAAISCTVTTEAVFEQFKDDPSDPMSYFSATSRPSAAAPRGRRRHSRNIADRRGREPDREHASDGRAYDGQSAHRFQDKHAVIGDVRGKGLFIGAELVSDRASREPAEEKMVQAVVADCMAQGVIIGATNRSLPGFNNTLCFSPALIATASDIDQITDSVDKALTEGVRLTRPHGRVRPHTAETAGIRPCAPFPKAKSIDKLEKTGWAIVCRFR